MAEPRKRRKRFAIALTPIVLFAAYVMSYFTVQWIEGRRFVPGAKKTYFPVRTVYAPILWYQGSDIPGGTECWALSFWFFRGGREPLSEIYEMTAELKQSESFRRRRDRGQ